MGAARQERKKRTRARLRARIADLEMRDRLRQLELYDTDAALAEAREYERRARELAQTLGLLVYVLCLRLNKE